MLDIPPLHHEVTEHQVVEIRCTCGKICRGAFPEGVSAPVQYGPRIKAAVVHLTNHHMMPIARTGALMGDFFGLPMSDATVLSANEEAKTRLADTVAAIGNALQTAPVAHADETGMRVAGKLHWMHVLATSTLTWIGCHPNRGKKAFEAFGILTGFLGTLIHDGWKPYRELPCKHGLCNVHHLRELTYLFEEMSQAWAKRLIDLLVDVCHEVMLRVSRCARSALPTSAPSMTRFSARAKPPTPARHRRADAALPSKARRPTCSVVCVSMPTMSGAL